MALGFERVTIVGVGLIGGSLGMVLRRRGLARRVVGVGHRQVSLDRAVALGAIDEGTLSVEAGVARSEVVVLAAPVGQVVPLAMAARGALARGTVVTDVASTKGRIVAALEPLLAAGGAHFVGAHPLAGSHRRSVEAAREDLFEGAVTVVTPTPASDPGAVSVVEALWREAGARIVRVSPAEHDALIAFTSHLPHVMAAALALTAGECGMRNAERGIQVSGMSNSQSAIRNRQSEIGSGRAEPRTQNPEPQLRDFVAGGFRDTTRVATSDPALWRDILLDNREAVLAAVEALRGRIDALRAALARADGPALEALLVEAKAARDALVPQKV